uniref:Uncharacterized protein n=1 Tax=Triticum urartu TaxID=4572 RepID=A0A8R7TW98_TRIUA
MISGQRGTAATPSPVSTALDPEARRRRSSSPTPSSLIHHASTFGDAIRQSPSPAKATSPTLFGVMPLRAVVAQAPTRDPAAMYYSKAKDNDEILSFGAGVVALGYLLRKGHS